MTTRQKQWSWAFGLFLALAALSATTYWNVLTDSNQVLAFNDANIEPLFSPNYGFPQAFTRIWDNQFFFGQGGGQAGITVTSLGETVFGPHGYRSGGQAIILALCGLAFYWLFRQYRLGRPASALAAALLMLSGWCNTFALSGLPVRPIALAFTALALGFVERGRQTRSWLAYAVGGGCLGLAIAEVPDVGALLAIASAFVFAWTHWVGGRVVSGKESIPPNVGGAVPCRDQPVQEPGMDSRRTLPKSASGGECASHIEAPPLAKQFSGSKVYGLGFMVSRFALYVTFSALLGWQTITGTIGTQIQGVKQGTEESTEARYAWATQWSIPPSETLDLVAGNYFGSSMRSETSPYWGRVGRSEGWEQTHQGMRNFNMTGRHLGVVPCLLLIALFILMLRRPNAGNVKQPPSPMRGSGVPWKEEKGEEGGYCFVHPRAFTWMIFLGSAVSLMLAWGKYFPLYRLFWSLPYISTFRNPEKWVGPLTLFVGLGIAFILDLIWRHLTSPNNSTAQQPDNRSLRASLLWAGLGLAGVAIMVLLGTSGNKTDFIARLVQEGYKDAASIAYDNAIAAGLKLLVISGLFTGIVLWLFRGQNPESRIQNPEGKKNRKARTESPPSTGNRSLIMGYSLLGLLAMIGLGDLCLDNRPFVMGHYYKHFLQPNPLTEFLDAHRSEGRIKLLPPQHPLLNSLRMTLFQVKGYDLFEPISVSRMPTDYEALFKALETQPARLWELGSLRYFITLPGGAEQLNKADGNRGRFVERLALGVGVVNETYLPVSTENPAQRYLRVVEFTGALPKHRLVGKITAVPPTPKGAEQALSRLAAPDFNPANEATVQSSTPIIALPPTHSSVKVVSDTAVDSRLEVETDQPCLLVRSVKDDPNWKATVDKRPVEVQCVDYLLQGVLIPSGAHTVTFSYEPPLRGQAEALAARLLLVVLALICLLFHRATCDTTQS